MSTSPCILVLDDESETVAETALTLIRLGVEPLYSKWLDEARLFAGEAGTRVGAAIASSRLAAEDLREFRESVRAIDAKRDIELLLVGPPTDPVASAALQADGFGAVLWQPFDESELRFAVGTLMLMPEEIAPRREPRAAANRMCWIGLGATRSFGVLYTVSAKGAYVEMPSPPPVGTELRLEFDLDGVVVATTARVIYAIGRDEARRSLIACGIGCVFTDLGSEGEAALRARVVRREGRHRLVPPLEELTGVGEAIPG